MAENSRQLKQKRSSVKGQVTRIHNFLTSGSEIRVEDARIRLERLQELWVTFDRYQTEIDEKPIENDEELEARIKDSDAERSIFEGYYYTAAAKATQVIESFERKEQEQQTKQQQQQQYESQQERRNRPKLQPLQIPKFNGQYTKWMFFKNTFESMIHNDVSLQPIEKHQYLVGVLEGEALQVIQGFSITETSYDSAWQLLKDTYDDQVMIIETHLDELLNFPIISKENKADSIRQFIWHIQTHYKSLEALGQPVTSWETIIIHLAKKKLEFVEQRDWQTIIKDKKADNLPKLAEFIKFLTERCHSLRLLNQNKPKPNCEKQTQQKKHEKKVSLAATSAGLCKICNGSHPVFKCEELLKLSVHDRQKEVREKQLCVNCLGSGHYAKNCKSSSCKKCSGRHNTMLHRESEHSTGTETVESQIVTHCAAENLDGISREMRGNNEDDVGVYCVQKLTSQIILSTAKVYAYDKHGNQRICRVLLDPGSQSNLVTESLVRKLQLQCKEENRPISGINQARTDANKITNIKVQSTQNEFEATLECLVLPSITERLPQNKIDVEKIIIPKNIRLADPTFDEPGTIDLLIGAGVYWKLLLGTVKNRLEGQPALQNTHFGWILGGEMYDAPTDSSAACLAVTNDTLNLQMERFWRQEDILEVAQYTDEEKACEKYITDTLERDSTGRFIVRLPTRKGVTLGTSTEIALRRLISVERKLSKNPELKAAYFQFMDDYVNQDHMTEVSAVEQETRTEQYLLPHQAVVRPDSITTKLRVVFDASTKTTLGTSLNDKLLSGPNLQRDLIDIILRFRAHEYVVTADVAMMFRQILVNKKDRAMQRILWRKDPRENPKVFELNTVTYGTTCAPYLAIRCLRQAAIDDGTDLPQAANAIIQDCYMD